VSCGWLVGIILYCDYIGTYIRNFSSGLPPAAAGNRHSIIGIVTRGGDGNNTFSEKRYRYKFPLWKPAGQIDHHHWQFSQYCIAHFPYVRRRLLGGTWGAKPAPPPNIECTTKIIKHFSKLPLLIL